VLAPGQIGAPIRAVLGRHENTTVIEATVTGVDVARGCVIAANADRENVPIAYDYLILATGARHSYFAHPEFEQFAPGLKSLADAEAIRNKVLQAFEQAEAEEDPNKHRELLTFVARGGGADGRGNGRGPGGPRQDHASLAVPQDRPDLRADRPCGQWASGSSGRSPRASRPRPSARLEQLGVEVLLGKGVDKIDKEGVVVAGERIASATVIWTAGVAPSPAGKWLGAGGGGGVGIPMDKAGRVRVSPTAPCPATPTSSWSATPRRWIRMASRSRASRRSRCSRAAMSASCWPSASGAGPIPSPSATYDKGTWPSSGRASRSWRATSSA